MYDWKFVNQLLADPRAALRYVSASRLRLLLLMSTVMSLLALAFVFSRVALSTRAELLPRSGQELLSEPLPPLAIVSPAAAAATADERLGHSRSLPTVYVITPTYPRAVQVAELTRLAQTLMHAPHVFWVVAEDAERLTPAVAQLLARTGLAYVHILGVKPERYINAQLSHVPRGVSNRLAGLNWVRRWATSGVVYFADDDNSYDYRLFFEMAHTKGISVFPVGLVTDFGVSTPLVRNGTVVGFYDGWVAGRKFPMDMAGFAVSVKLLLERPNATMPFTPGYEEDGFIQSLGVSKEQFELLANNCTEILVWHTQTKKRGPFTKIDMTKYGDTNLHHLSPLILQKDST